MPLTNDEMIAGLHPSIRDMTWAFLRKAFSEDFHLRITHGTRTIAEQNALWEQGRKKPGSIVTNARGGESFHNFGLAFDVVDTRKGYAINWDRLGDIARSVGLEHGDRGAVDRPHFQYRGGLSLEQVQRGERPAVPEKKEPIKQPVKKRIMKIAKEHRCVYVKDGDKAAELWIIEKHPKPPLETRHKVEMQKALVISVFGQNGALKEMSRKELLGLTEGKPFDINNEAIIHPGLFQLQ